MSARAAIDLNAFNHNLTVLERTIAPVPVMLMVKANAYGHGLLEIVQTASTAGVSRFGVLDVETALFLRKHNVTSTLFAWLHGSSTPWLEAIEANIDLGVSSILHLEAIAQACTHAGATAQVKPVAQVHLKIDTGLHRNGVNVDQWEAFVTYALMLERRDVLHIRGIWSHLADTSTEDDLRALRIFNDACAQARALGARPEVLHLAASTAGFCLPEAHFDMVRFGLVAYGVSSVKNVSAKELNIEPVMSVEADVVAIDRERQVARIDIGFGDGLCAVDTDQAHIVIGNGQYPICSVDVDTLEVCLEHAGAETERIKVGDTAYVFGAGVHGEASITTWAQWCDTAEDEVMTRLASRVERVYVRG